MKSCQYQEFVIPLNSKSKNKKVDVLEQTVCTIVQVQKQW